MDLTIPRIYILNNKEQYLTTIDNSRKNSLRFKNEKLTIYLKNSAQIFEAEFIKSTEDSKYLSVGNKLVFNYKKEDYFFTIVSIEEDEYTAKVTALGIALEASNSIREKYDADRTYTIAEYINKFDFEKMLTIRLNQISDRELKVSLSEESFLQRIYSLADLFNAEIMILPVLNDDRSIKQIAIDIYKKDEGDQGIGDYHPEIRLRYGKNISTVKRTVDIMQLKTAIKPIGNNGLTLVGYQVDVKDENNKQLYYSTEQSGYIYAPQARDRFPSNKTGSNANDFYIEYTKTYSTDSQSELANLALADLKADSEPKISYEVDTFHTDLNIGDTIRIDDSAYTPNLMLEARVTKLEICFTDPTKNKITFSNFVELKSEIDPALIAKMKELAEQNKVYNAQILTDNTVVFKNNQGETTLIARVLDGIKDITDTLTITWLKGDLEVGNGKNLRVTAADVNGVQLYRFNAFKDGKLIGQAQISVADVVDGTDGQPGADGQPGEDGENAINAYLTNENITLKADTQGNLKSGQLALASGQMVVVDGPNVVTSGVSYSIVKQNGCTATIDSNGNYRLTAMTADSASVILRSSYKGSALQKTFNVNKLYDALPGQNGQDGQDGKSPIVGYLTNENFIIQTNQDGSLDYQSLAKANGYFNVYQGQSKITNGVAYSIVSQTGVNVSLNADTGYYNVNSMSADFGTAIFKAVYNDVELQKQLMVVKNKSAIGVVVADNPPSNPLVGQLWKNTGYGNGYSYGTTYYYTGSSWQVYLFYASNIQADNLSAISANLGRITSGYIGNSNSYWDLSTGNFLNSNGTNSSVSIGKGRILVSNKNSFDSSSVSGTSYDSLELGTNCITLGNSSGFLEIRPTTIGIGGSSGSATILSSGGLRFGYDFNATIGWFKNVDRFNNWYDISGYRYQSGRFDLTNGSFDTTGGAVQITANSGPVNLQGDSVNVRNKYNTAYVDCYAQRFSSQSAHSIKTDFENVSTERLLQAVLNTDIVSFRFKNDNQRNIGFIINDDGESPYQIDDLIVDDNGTSFNTTTTTGILFGAVKALNDKVKILENIIYNAKGSD